MKVFLAFAVLCALGGAMANPINNNDGPLVEEMSGKFEGDIVLTPEQEDAILRKRTGLINQTYRWSHNIVPYTLDATMSDAQRTAIRDALDEMEANLCLKFVERTDQSDYVRVTITDSGCFSKVGRVGGVQQLNLQSYEPGSGCFRKGTIIHEFIHAIGFYHMQSATERDEYVRIAWENIEPGKEHNFNTYGADRISQFQVPYDYGSVMHYSSKAFSINGEETIVALDGVGGQLMGQRVGMSESDIKRINNMYC